MYVQSAPTQLASVSPSDLMECCLVLCVSEIQNTYDLTLTNNQFVIVFMRCNLWKSVEVWHG